VKRIVFLHRGVTYVAYRDGSETRSKRLVQEVLMEAASRVSRRSDCRITIAVE
jgi:hypothetical protein